MAPEELVANIVPPTLAIALQVWQIPNKTIVKLAAAEAARQANVEIADLVEQTIRGQLAISSIAPSFVSVVNGLFQLGPLLRDGVTLIYVFVGAVIILLLAILNFVSGINSVDLLRGKYPRKNVSDEELEERFRLAELSSGNESEARGARSAFRSYGPNDIIKWGVYCVNLMLICIVLGIYAYQNIYKGPSGDCARRVPTSHEAVQSTCLGSTTFGCACGNVGVNNQIYVGVPTVSLKSSVARGHRSSSQ